MKSKRHRARNKNAREDQYTRVHCVRFEILKAGSQRLLFLVAICGVMQFGNGNNVLKELAVLSSGLTQ